MNQTADRDLSADYPDWKKKTAIFLSGQTLSLFGSSLVQYAIIWHITLTTESGVYLTISTLCGFLPQILISIFAGVWADRYNRKKLIILADLLTATSTLILAILFLLGYGELWLLFLVSAIRSIGGGIQSPAVGALLPQIVPPDKLMKINGLNSTLQPVMMILAPVSAGALMAFSDLEIIFFIDVITAAIAIGLLLALRVAPHQKAGTAQNTGYLDDLKAGLRYIKGNRVIRSLFIFYAFLFFLVTPVAFLSPLLVARSYGEEVWRLTANEVTFFVGSIIGGLIISAWGGFKSHFRTIGLGCIAWAVLFGALGLTSNFTIYLAIMFLSGIPMPITNVPTTTLLQEMVEPDMQGRVFGVFQLIISTVFPLGMLFFGPLADRVSIEILLVVCGVLMFLPGIWLFFNRTLSIPVPIAHGGDENFQPGD